VSSADDTQRCPISRPGPAIDELGPPIDRVIAARYVGAREFDLAGFLAPTDESSTTLTSWPRGRRT
jgi:hypothetical protein